MGGYQRKLIMCPVVANLSGISLIVVDKDALRRALLYWDQLLVLDDTDRSVAWSDDDEFLKSAKILKPIQVVREVDRSKPLASGIDLMPPEVIYEVNLAHASRKLEERRDAIYSIYGPSWSTALADDVLVDFPSLELKLFNLLPVPKSGVPFNDILEFKHRRKDELEDLRFAIDNLVEDARARMDGLRAEDQSVAKVSKSLEHLRRVVNESLATRLLSNVTISVNGATVVSALGATGLLLSELPPLVTGTLASISIGTAVRRRHKDLPGNVSAFRYAVEAERELT